MPRELIEDTPAYRVYRVTDAGGALLGYDTESIPTSEQVKRATIEQAVADALAQNRQIVTGADTYLASDIVLPASPTTAQVTAAVKAYGAQVAALTTAAKWAAQQRNGLIRLVLNELDATD